MKSLLIVDDEPAIRSIVSRWAETRGYAVAEAEGADAGLARLRERQADRLADLAESLGDRR